MRLLDTTTLRLREFVGDSVPPYAILSHTWNEGEITFQEMRRPTSAIRQKPGYLKVVACAKVARSNGFHYLWADTCCIDKSSSAELQEAINSMFKWYADAEVCYAYLVDVHSDSISNFLSLRHSDALKTSFASSRWFKRGWTLQELLAPRSLSFFAADWSLIGSKRQLLRTLSSITKIEHDYLLADDLTSATVAERMSWASSRTTTRIEDMAYCLMGLFDVNMPMLYGEGKKAFLRLQEEIVKNSDDHTVFAWTANEQSYMMHRGIFAESPLEFASARGLMTREMGGKSSPSTNTSAGFHLRLPLVPASKALDDTQQLWYLTDDRDYVGVLNCSESNMSVEKLGILLTRLSTDGDQFARVSPNSLVRVSLPAQRKAIPEDIYVKNKLRVGSNYFSRRFAGFKMAWNSVPWGPPIFWPSSHWDTKTGILSAADDVICNGGLVGGISFFRKGKVYNLCLGIASEGGCNDCRLYKTNFVPSDSPHSHFKALWNSNEQGYEMLHRFSDSQRFQYLHSDSFHVRFESTILDALLFCKLEMSGY